MPTLDSNAPRSTDRRTLANPFFFPGTRCPLALFSYNKRVNHCQSSNSRLALPQAVRGAQDLDLHVLYVLRIHLLHPSSYVFEKRSPERLFIPTIEKETRRTMWWGIYLYTGSHARSRSPPVCPYPVHAPAYPPCRLCPTSQVLEIDCPTVRVDRTSATCSGCTIHPTRKG
jgi:hypothetical protein